MNSEGNGFFFSSERSWLEQGHKVGELIIPLARNFYDTKDDVEFARKSPVCQSSYACNGYIKL